MSPFFPLKIPPFPSSPLPSRLELTPVKAHIVRRCLSLSFPPVPPPRTQSLVICISLFLFFPQGCDAPARIFPLSLLPPFPSFRLCLLDYASVITLSYCCPLFPPTCFARMLFRPLLLFREATSPLFFRISLQPLCCSHYESRSSLYQRYILEDLQLHYLPLLAMDPSSYLYVSG